MAILEAEPEEVTKTRTPSSRSAGCAPRSASTPTGDDDRGTN